MNQISATDFKKKYLSGQVKRVLDVREDWEFQEGHLDGAKNLSVYVLPENYHVINDWKNEEFFVHCQSGKRSKIAHNLLINNGFNKAIDVQGGYDAIKNA